MAEQDPGKTTLRGATAVPRFAVRHGGRTIPLREGVMFIGRGADCDVVLDSALVSRKHACIVTAGDLVQVEDLGSSNGVKVDSVRIEGRVPITVGARISVADELLELVPMAEDRRSVTARGAAQTLQFQAPEVEPAPVERSERRADAFALLANVVDKSLALGRGDEAERLISALLHDVRRDAEARQPLPSELPGRAVHYAIRLARATQKATWVDYAFQLYRALGRPLPMDVVDELHDLMRKLPGVNLEQIRRYVEELRALDLGPAERFAIRRIEGLMRVAASVRP